MNNLIKLIDECDAIVIGAGAGLSTAAGLEYSGDRFEKYFSDFISKYHFTDMYTAGFHSFENMEEYYAYWSRHIKYNRYVDTPKNTYHKLLEIIKDKNYFVITTNVDHQFIKAGFDKQRVFYTQGDYGLLQCSKGCHEKTYDNEALINQMIIQQTDMKIPTNLVPICPKCGSYMVPNLRCDHTFVEDKGWHQASKRYQQFISNNLNKKVVYLELGVGYNTPVIIKYPFMQLTKNNLNATYVCINNQDAYCSDDIHKQSLLINDDIDNVINQILINKQIPRLQQLIKELLAETKYKIEIPNTYQDLFGIYRSLVNIRLPGSVTNQYTILENTMLQTELLLKNPVTFNKDEKIILWQGDITRLNVDGIVNAANNQMLGCFHPGHHCIDNAIHTFAGVALRNKCNQIIEKMNREANTGECIITNAYNLPSKYIIHTVGPIIYNELTNKEIIQLENTYINCLKMAEANNMKSIAFCCISTGEYRFPKDIATKIAVNTVTKYLETSNIEQVIFNVFKDDDLLLYQKALNINAYKY